MSEKVRYRVHLFPIFRISVDIESDEPMTPEQAIEEAEDRTLYHRFAHGGMEYADETAPYVCVDVVKPNGDVEYGKWYDWKQAEGRYVPGARTD